MLCGEYSTFLDTYIYTYVLYFWVHYTKNCHGWSGGGGRKDNPELQNRVALRVTRVDGDHVIVISEDNRQQLEFTSDEAYQIILSNIGL